MSESSFIHCTVCGDIHQTTKPKNDPHPWTHWWHYTHCRLCGQVGTHQFHAWCMPCLFLVRLEMRARERLMPGMRARPIVVVPATSLPKAPRGRAKFVVGSERSVTQEEGD